MAKNLVIVESPAKAKTLTKFLGSDYKVLASFGHVSDLPKNELGFDPDNDFKPKYLVSPDKKRVISELKKNIGPDTTVYLAADEDREGESIAWHLLETLKLQKHDTKRIVFHEITKSAILHAIEHPGKLNMNMVDAQQARRVLDRAVGYKLSPLLWTKIKYGLSAGRVQSVALRIVVDKENEISAFIPEEYWKLKLDILSNPNFKAEFSKHNGKITKVTNVEQATNIKTECDKYDYVLDDIVEKDSTRNPSPPFTTSTLQQEASNKAGLAPKQTMMLAQKLYEGNHTLPNHTGGLITYMRTDSTNLSTLALNACKEVILKEYGKEYSLTSPRIYSKSKGKVAAQEAHEAIRPVNMNLKPSDLSGYLDSRELKLYTLIWQRTLATQMAQAKVANTTYKIYGGKDKEYEFVAKGTKIVFPGFMKAYTVEDSNSKDKFLPNVPKGTIFKDTELTTEQNFTKPPARYSEASLIKKMEAEGVGRPSTYASTLSTISTRGYVILNDDKKLEPTTIGKVVTEYLLENFSDIVNLSFTANIEAEFDKIANGEIKWQSVMHNFYDNFVKTVNDKQGGDRVQFSKAKEIGTDKETGLPIFVKEGTHGVYIQIGEANKEEKIKPHKISPVPKGVKLDDITLDQAKHYLKVPRVLGDKNTKPIKVGIGRFGPYLQWDNKYYSIKPSYEISPYEIGFKRAVEIINEVDKEKAKALVWTKDNTVYGTMSIINGRYGVYLNVTGKGKNKKANYKIPKDITEDKAKSLKVDEVINIIENQPKTNNKGKKWKK